MKWRSATLFIWDGLCVLFLSLMVWHLRRAFLRFDYPDGFRLFLWSLAALLVLHSWRLITLFHEGWQRHKGAMHMPVKGDTTEELVPHVIERKGSHWVRPNRTFMTLYDAGMVGFLLLNSAVSAAIIHDRNLRTSAMRATVSNLHMIRDAENACFSKAGHYGSLAELSVAVPPFVNGNWVGAVKDGYRFDLTVGTDGKTFKVIATAENNKYMGFYLDENGPIRYGVDGKKLSASSPIYEDN